MIEENNIALPSAQFSEGLRSYMLRVYNYMIGGLLVSALFAWLGTSEPMLRLMFNINEVQGEVSYSIPGLIILLAPFVFIPLVHSSAQKLNVVKAQFFFWAYSAIDGLSLSFLCLIYSGSSITTAFLLTAVTFSALSLYGYTTQRDLTGIGQFCFIGLIGVIISLIVNMFLGSEPLSYLLSIILVLLFIGLTAFDTQKIRCNYQLSASNEETHALAIVGALELYLDFINLFINILRLTGSRQK